MKAFIYIALILTTIITSLIFYDISSRSIEISYREHLTGETLAEFRGRCDAFRGEIISEFNIPQLYLQPKSDFYWRGKAYRFSGLTTSTLVSLGFSCSGPWRSGSDSMFT